MRRVPMLILGFLSLANAWATDLPPLDLSAPTTKNWSERSEHRYQIKLTTRRTLITLEPGYFDFAVSLRRSDGTQVLRVDAPGMAVSREYAFYEPPEEDQYIVEVHLNGPSTESTQYTLSISQPLFTPEEADAALLATQASSIDLADPTANRQLKIQEAMALYEATAVAWSKANKPHEQSRALAILGWLAFELDNAKKAQISFSKAFNLGADSPIEHAWYQAYVGVALMDQDKLITAQNAFVAAWELSRAVQDDRGNAAFLNYLGLVNQYRNQPAAAGRWYRQALSAMERLDDPHQQATTLSNLGGTQYQIGRFDQALKFYNQALDINNRINDANEQATVLGNIASLYRDQGDLQRSLDYNLRTLDIYRSRNSNQGIALVYHRLGLLFQRMGDFERSESYYTQAYELRKNSSRGRAASTLRGLASLYAQQGKHQTAQETQKQALSLFESIGSSTNQARVELELAKSALELGQVNEAATFVNRALPVLKKASLNPLVGEGTEVLGKVAASQSDLERAKQQFQEAVRLYREASNPIGEINALVGLATLEADDQQALEALQLAETTANVVRESIGNPELKARFVATTTSLYDQLITRHLNVYQETGDKGHMAKAFFVHEKSRGRSLFELLARGESSIDEPTNNRLTLRSELQKELNGLWSSNRRLNGGSNSREASSLVEQNNTKIRDLRTQLDGVYAELAQDQFGVGTQDVNLEAVQAKLGSGDRLLQIHLGEKVATLWWISSNRVEVKALPPKEDLAAQVQKAYEALIEPDFDEADQATLMGLYEVLTKDLSGFDEAKTVYLVVDGYLQYLPFAALMPRKGRFLGEDTNFVSLPAARVLLNDLEKQKFNDDTKVLVLADPVYDDVDYRAQNAGTLSRAAQAMNMERIERLPFSGMEAESIQSHAENALVVTGFDASKSYVLDQASQHDVLHFATHGIANDRNPQLSGLVLSLLDADQKPQPGFLSLLDIESLSINPSLVVLSACDTGLGEDIPLEGTMSLSRGFLAQGADQVVASLWQVNDRATAELMDSFYEGLFAKQLTVKDALRRAQSKIANTPRWRAPYFWAGFVAHAVTP